MSADRFKLKRGTTAQVNAYLPAMGEPVYDTTLKQLKIGDGIAFGGNPIATSLTANKLTTARNIALSGSVTGTVAFDGSADVSITTSVGAPLQATLDSKAPLASPTFTGVPTAPTAVPGTNTTQVASTAFVDAARVILAASDALKAPLASPALTGTPTTPTASAGTNTTQIASTAFVEAARVILVAADALKAPLASPGLTGVPVAPTPAVGTNTTQLATSAMVQAEIANKRAWTSYTPTVTGTTGTFTAASATGKYMVAFGVCYCQAVITITTVGTGTKPQFTLPVPALAGCVQMPLPAAESALNGKVGAAKILAALTGAQCVDYTNGDLVTGNGSVIYINGSYPVA